MMKTLVSACLILGVTSFAWSQGMIKSEYLGKDNGLPNLGIGSLLAESINGVDTIPKGDAHWSGLGDSEWRFGPSMLGDPGKVGFTAMAGLRVKRIEIFCSQDMFKNDKGEWVEGLGISSIAVFLELPNSDNNLKAFYKKIYDLYGPTLGATGFRDDYELLQWHSATECGAMMNIPDMNDLKQCKDNGLEYLEVRFVPSCGG